MTKPIKIESPERAELILSAHPNGGWTVASSHDCCPPQTLAAYGSADEMLADLARVLVKPGGAPLSQADLDFIKRNDLAPMRNYGTKEPEVDRA